MVWRFATFAGCPLLLAAIGTYGVISYSLPKGDLAAAGQLMNESHASLRDLYEVSSPELDLVSSLARSHPDCYGARMTGAGFGGCAVALVVAGHVEEFRRTVHAAYRAQVDLPSAFFACRPAVGARLVD